MASPDDGFAGKGASFVIGVIEQRGKFQNAAQALAVDDTTVQDQDFGLINQGGGFMQQCWIKTAP